MNNINLQSIKHESIRGIFQTITEADKISRAEIAGKTGLSLVTVGKIADALLDMDILTQEKEIRPQAGRRAGILRVNPALYAVILDLTSADFRYTVMNLRLQPIETGSYRYRSELTYDENLTAFLTETAVGTARKYGEDSCFGLGLSVPGPYHGSTDTVSTCRVPELRLIHLRETAERCFARSPLIIDSQINAAARSSVSHIDGYRQKNIVYWHISPSLLCGATLMNGELILGRDNNPCDFGRMLYSYGLTLEEKVALCKNEEECAEALSGPIHNVLKILNPHAMVMEHDLPYPCEDMIPLIEKQLISRYGMSSDEVPDILSAPYNNHNAAIGLTLSLRDSWLDRMVFGPSERQ